MTGILTLGALEGRGTGRKLFVATSEVTQNGKKGVHPPSR